jgi:RNA polymerase sigma-70 factor (ECF subfamily)
MRLEGQRRFRWGVDSPPGAAEPDDGALIRRYQRDPEGPAGRSAVDRLLARYRRRVLIWCWQVVQDREQALDLAQEVLLNALRNLPRYHERQRFSAWLFTIARNRCLSELRRRRVPVATEAVLDMLVDESPRPDRALEWKANETQLLRLVEETLTPLERDALWLRCFEGMAVEVITHRLEIEERSGARAVLQRARRKLRAALAARDDESRGGSS